MLNLALKSNCSNNAIINNASTCMNATYRSSGRARLHGSSRFHHLSHANHIQHVSTLKPRSQSLLFLASTLCELVWHDSTLRNQEIM